MTSEPPDSRTDFSVKPTLVGAAVVLRPFVLDEDAGAIRELLLDPEVARLTGSGIPGPWDEAAEQRMRDWSGTRHEQPDRLDLAVVDRADGACVGEVVLNSWDAANRNCNVRIGLVVAGQSRGLGTEAMRLMVGHGFEQLGLHRISLSVFSSNPRARRAYEKVGSVLEGVRRDAHRHDGGWADGLEMAILAPEWERHTEAGRSDDSP